MSPHSLEPHRSALRALIHPYEKTGLFHKTGIFLGNNAKQKYTSQKI